MQNLYRSEIEYTGIYWCLTISTLVSTCLKLLYGGSCRSPRSEHQTMGPL